MKKVYEKPLIMFESFEISTNIAGDCNGIVGNSSKGTCAVIGTGGINMFTDDITACDFAPQAPWDQYCYHNPTEYNDLFNS